MVGWAKREERERDRPELVQFVEIFFWIFPIPKIGKGRERKDKEKRDRRKRGQGLTNFFTNFILILK